MQPVWQKRIGCGVYRSIPADIVLFQQFAKTTIDNGVERLCGATEVQEKRGINRIPQWLTRDKGLPDWLAGTVVVIVGGLLLAGFLGLLIAIFPAK